MFSQIPAFVLGIISTASVITTTFWNQWSISGPTSDQVLGGIWAWRSLFGSCMQFQNGQYQCQGQNSLFLKSGMDITFAALMITSIILSVVACFAMLCGMECTRILENNRNLKRRIMIICGFCYFSAGLLTLVTVGWYTSNVYNNFFSIANQDDFIQWELGACIYLGFISSLLSVISFLACVCAPGPRQNGRVDSYAYQPNRFGPITSTSRGEYRIRENKHKNERTEYV